MCVALYKCCCVLSLTAADEFANVSEIVAKQMVCYTCSYGALRMNFVFSNVRHSHWETVTKHLMSLLWRAFVVFLHLYWMRSLFGRLIMSILHLNIINMWKYSSQWQQWYIWLNVWQFKIIYKHTYMVVVFFSFLRFNFFGTMSFAYYIRLPCDHIVPDGKRKKTRKKH